MMHGRASPFPADLVVEEMEARTRIRARTDLNREEYFLGHFPGNPVLPGVFLLELVHQAIALLLGDESRLFRLRKIDSMRFLSPAGPADRVVCECVIKNAQKTDAGEELEIKAECSSGGKRLAVLQLAYARRNET